MDEILVQGRQMLDERCQLLVENVVAIRRNYRWIYAMSQSLCAMIFTLRGEAVDLDKMEQCQKIIKANTGPLSNFRGTLSPILSSLLCAREDPQSTFEHTIAVYRSLKEDGFHSGQYLAMTAYTIASHTEKQGDYSDVVDKLRHIYRAIKAEHPLLTSSQDYGFLAILALSDQNTEDLVAEAEACYEQLKRGVFSNNAIHTVCQLLALGNGSTEEKCNRVDALLETFKEKHHRFGSGTELIGIGILALIDEDLDVLTDKVIEISETLKQQKGFRTLEATKPQRLMYASALVSQDYLDQMKMREAETAVTYQVSQAILAMEMAMIGAIAASAAAASASASASSSS